MKYIVIKFVLFAFSSCFVNALSSEEVTEISELCCSHAQSFAVTAPSVAACGKVSPPEDVEPDQMEACTPSLASCCKDQFKDKDACTAGMKLAPAKQCAVPEADIAKSCCEECSFGRLAGETQGKGGCGSPPEADGIPSSVLKKNAFYQCCMEAAETPETTTEKKPETTTQKAAPKQKCAKDSCEHICDDETGVIKCQCKPGFRLHSDNKSCKDINECAEAIDDVCTADGTVCHNTVGAFKCVPIKKRDVGLSCPPGFKRNILNQVCDDINECQMPRPPCPKYLCENTIGGYKCAGKPGKPVTEAIPGAVTEPSAETTIKNDICPPGFRAGPDDECLDIDECEERLDDCQRLSQHCINTHGNFFCQDHVSKRCAPGFKVNIATGICEDIDECEESSEVCKRTEICINLPGAYNCKSKISTLPKLAKKTCQEGTRLRPGGTICEDIDECREGTHLCDQFQNCINTYGAHECRCKNGFELDSSTSACVDIDECALKLDNCAAHLHCLNVLGSFTCTYKPPSTTSTTTLAPPMYEYEYYDSEEVGGTSNLPPPPPRPVPVTTSTTTTPRPTTTSTTPAPTTTSTTPKPTTTSSTTTARPRPYYPYTRPTTTTRRPTYPPRRPYTPRRPDPTPARPVPTDITPPVPENSRPDYSLRDPDPTIPNYPDNSPTRPESPPRRPENYPRRPSLPRRPDSTPSRPPTPTRPQNNPTRPSYPTEVTVNRPENPTVIEKETDETGVYSINTDTLPKDTWNNVIGRERPEAPKPEFDVNNLHCMNGYEKDAYGRCVDINECEERRHICNNLEDCVNQDGGYYCECIIGYSRNDDGWCVPAIIPTTTSTTTSTTPSTTTSTTTTTTTTTTERPTAVATPEWPYPPPRVPPRDSRVYPPVNCELGYKYDRNIGACVDINECATNKATCSINEDCVNIPGGFRCVCGPQCRALNEKPTYVATPSPPPRPTDVGNTNVITVGAQYGQRGPWSLRPTYSRLPESGAIVTSCPWGYKLTGEKRCFDIDECARNTSDCGPMQRCENFYGGYSCQCPAGHRLVGQNGCDDIDECMHGNPCSYNAQCVNTVGSYRCVCSDGFRNAPSNDKVCVDIDECTETPDVCQQGCANAWGSYRCYCERGYRLGSDNKTCVDVDECEEWGSVRVRGKLCAGKCVNELGSYRCSCPAGYRLSEDGRSCIDIDECETGEAPCARTSTPGYVCQNTQGSFHCHRIECPAGYRLESKHRCTRVQRSCPVGDWTCLQQPSAYSYNFITFVANLYLPTGSVDLFTMHGPSWRDSVVSFEMRMLNVQASPGVQPADLRCFDMRPSGNICVISLLCALEGPQVAELELTMSLYQRSQFAGSAVARLIVIVSEYEF